MTRKIYNSKKKDMLLFLTVTLLFVAVCIGVLAMPKVSVDGARNGLMYSFGVLIPSLFPFMFLSNFAVEYGISSKVGRVLAPFTEKVLYLPSEAGVTVLLSLIGGFPIGAVGTSALYKQGKITEKQAQRMLCFCVNSGPAFLISVVGAELYDSELIGIILLTAQILSSLIIGIVLGLFARKKEPLQKSVGNAQSNIEFAPAFIISAKNACTATVNLCALVVLFSSFSSIFLTALKIDGDSPVGIIIKSVLEVTDGCNCISDAHLPIYLTSLAVGWSGICVHFQIFAAVENFKVNKTSFVLARIFNGTLSAALTFAATLFIVVDNEVFSNFVESEPYFSSSSFYGSLALFISSILFLIFMNTYIRGLLNHDKCIQE